MIDIKDENEVTINNIPVRPGQLWRKSYYGKDSTTGRYYLLRFGTLMLITSIDDKYIHYKEVRDGSIEELNYKFMTEIDDNLLILFDNNHVIKLNDKKIYDDKANTSIYSGTITRYSLCKIYPESVLEDLKKFEPLF